MLCISTNTIRITTTTITWKIAISIYSTKQTNHCKLFVNGREVNTDGRRMSPSDDFLHQNYDHKYLYSFENNLTVWGPLPSLSHLTFVTCTLTLTRTAPTQIRAHFPLQNERRPRSHIKSFNTENYENDCILVLRGIAGHFYFTFSGNPRSF